MNEVDERWVRDRGGLHDARVTAVRNGGKNLEIDIDDEWANERGLSRPIGQKRPITISFRNMTASDALLQTGWISEIVMKNGNFHLTFCDRPAVTIQASSVVWRAVPSISSP